METTSNVWKHLISAFEKQEDLISLPKLDPKILLTKSNSLSSGKILQMITENIESHSKDSMEKIDCLVEKIEKIKLNDAERFDVEGLIIYNSINHDTLRKPISILTNSSHVVLEIIISENSSLYSKKACIIVPLPNRFFLLKVRSLYHKNVKITNLCVQKEEGASETLFCLADKFTDIFMCDEQPEEALQRNQLLPLYPNSVSNDNLFLHSYGKSIALPLYVRQAKFCPLNDGILFQKFEFPVCGDCDVEMVPSTRFCIFSEVEAFNEEQMKEGDDDLGNYLKCTHCNKLVEENENALPQAELLACIGHSETLGKFFLVFDSFQESKAVFEKIDSEEIHEFACLFMATHLCKAFFPTLSTVFQDYKDISKIGFFI